MTALASTSDVSVVVPTRNRSPLLRAALDSLLAQSATGVRYEVLVVDNDSSDDTARTVATYAISLKPAKVLHTPEIAA
jgi:glycosyltransferase involved in cell wall biosynthesis